MDIDNRRRIVADYLDARTRLPFEHGVNDSMLMVAGVVAALTGVDHGAPYRGRYASCSGGQKLVGMSLLKFARERFDEIPPAKAGDGDIAVMRQGRHWVFGVYSGAHIYGMTADGMGIKPRRDAVRAFKVN